MGVLQAIAQTGRGSGGPVTEIWLWVIVLIVVIVLGGLIVLGVRRSLFARDDRGKAQSGLMDDVRSMHASGQLNDEEYDRVRKRMAARAAGQDPDRVAPVDPGGEVRHAKPGFDLAGEPLPRPAHEPQSDDDPGPVEPTSG